MYGAILGDIMSWWHKSENDGIFYLVDKEFKFSDYTVMTIAIADALLSNNENKEGNIEGEIIQSLITWGKKYTSVDASQHFRKWLNQDGREAIDDFDNSAAAVISAIPCIYRVDSPDQIIEIAQVVASFTHSNTQSIDNAGMAALAIFYAKMCPRAVLRNNLESAFACDFDDPNDLTNIVFEAIRDFLDSTDLESAINNAIARGGDIRTRAVITGSIAEAFYGISGANKSWCNSNLTEEMLKVLDKFDQAARRAFIKANAEDGINMSDNEKIETAISRFRDEDTEDNFERLMDSIYHRMHEGAELFVPLVIRDKNKAYAEHKIYNDDGEYLRLQAFDGKLFFVAFTSMTDELDEEFPDTYLTDIKDFLEEFEEEADEEGGIILNPNDEKKQFALTRPLIKMLLKEKPPENEMWYFRGNIDELKTKIEATVVPDYDNFEQSAFEDDNLLAAAHFMTKAENGDQYIIHTPLLSYRGTNKDVIFRCYWYCLELARKYHIHSIAFPAQFSTARSVQTSDGVNAVYVDLYMILHSWFKKNDTYGMKVLAVVNDTETDGKGQYIKADFMDFDDEGEDNTTDLDDDSDESTDKTDYTNNEEDSDSEEEKKLEMNNEKAEAYKKLVLDVQKKYPAHGTKGVDKISIDISQEFNKKGDPDAREVVKKFASTFADKNDFYKTLKEFGLDWPKNSKNNESIYEMRAKEALRIAIENGFDPFDVVTNKDTPVELFAPLFDGENICHEINLYTYWQGLGYAEKTPKIKYLLVAQDWGNLNLSQDFIERIKKWNAGDRSPLYPAKPNEIGTDRNLFELFEILGYDLSKRCDELFFTNFCLGYRSADTKAVGGMTKELMMKDAGEFKRLCEILEPENILCLGKITAECVYKALKGLELEKTYGDAKNYNEYLDNQAQMVLAYGEGNKILSNVYSLAHCGYMGTLNRPLKIQKQDWKNIADEKKD